MTVQMKFRRGGREFKSRSLDSQETGTKTFGAIQQEVGVTEGLGTDYEVFVRQEDSEYEIFAHNKESESLENILRSASSDGQIAGKTFIVDCTVQHVGADTLTK